MTWPWMLVCIKEPQGIDTHVWIVCVCVFGGGGGGGGGEREVVVVTTENHEQNMKKTAHSENQL